MKPRYKNKAWVYHYERTNPHPVLIGQIDEFDIYMVPFTQTNPRCFAVWGPTGNQGSWVGERFRLNPQIYTFCQAYLNIIS